MTHSVPPIPARIIHELFDPNRPSFSDDLRERAAVQLERDVAFIVNLLGLATLVVGVIAVVAL